MKVAVMAVVLIFMGALLRAEILYTDQFGDGVRNTILWKAVNEGAHFAETAGHLYGLSGTNVATRQGCQWRLKKIYGLFPGNTLLVEARVRMPSTYLGASSGTLIGIGIAYPNHSDEAKLMVGIFGAFRVAYGMVTTNSTPNFPLPSDVKQFRIRIKYNETTGLVKFYLAEADGVWQFLGSRNLDALFGPFYTAYRPISAFIEFGAINKTISSGNGVWIDDFRFVGN